jgi:hypothetical protein
MIPGSKKEISMDESPISRPSRPRDASGWRWLNRAVPTVILCAAVIAGGAAAALAE